MSWGSWSACPLKAKPETKSPAAPFTFLCSSNCNGREASTSSVSHLVRLSSYTCSYALSLEHRPILIYVCMCSRAGRRLSSHHSEQTAEDVHRGDFQRRQVRCDGAYASLSCVRTLMECHFFTLSFPFRVQNMVSSSMRVKIAAYCLALMLHMDHMTADLTLLHRDLGITEAKWEAVFVYCVSICFTNAFHPLRQLNFGSNREKNIKVNGVDSCYMVNRHILI